MGHKGWPFFKKSITFDMFVQSRTISDQYTKRKIWSSSFQKNEYHYHLKKSTVRNVEENKGRVCNK